MMLDNGEHMGWVARQVGHNSPKMIFERYYSYIQNYQSDDGQKFMSKLNDITMQGCNKVVPKLSHLKKKELA